MNTEELARMHGHPQFADLVKEGFVFVENFSWGEDGMSKEGDLVLFLIRMDHECVYKVSFYAFAQDDGHQLLRMNSLWRKPIVKMRS